MRYTKTRLIRILALLVIVFVALSLACCKNNQQSQWVNKVCAIKTEKSTYETFVGEFDYKTVSLTAEYLDGMTETLSLDISMISNEDAEKQNRIGEHKITVNYENVSCTFNLIVVEDKTQFIEFLDAETVYNGKPQSLIIYNLPSYATVEYENNSHTDAGSYQVKATVFVPNDIKLEYSAVLTIAKAPLVIKAEAGKAYFNQPPRFSYEVIGLVGSDDQSVLSTLPTLVSQNPVSAVGVYKDYVKFEGAVAKNYEISYVGADYTIIELPEIQTVSGKRYVEFGEYPQTVVSNEQVVLSLNEGINNGSLLPNSKGYYTLNGKSYVKMTANNYVNGESYNKFTNGDIMVKGMTYYFEVQPIRWQVISDGTGFTLLSEKLLDTEPFWDINNVATINGVSYNPNNYEQSEIRKWLNGDFMDIAFGLHEQDLMNKVTITNGAEDGVSSKYPCANTTDYVWLPSYKEITSATLGFSTDIDRMALTTDYVRALGTYMRPSLPTDPVQLGYGQYYLRTAGDISIRDVSVVDCFGNPNKEAQSGSFIVCVRPVININLAV